MSTATNRNSSNRNSQHCQHQHHQSPPATPSSEAPDRRRPPTFFIVLKVATLTQGTKLLSLAGVPLTRRSQGIGSKAPLIQGTLVRKHARKHEYARCVTHFLVRCQPGSDDSMCVCGVALWATTTFPSHFLHRLLVFTVINPCDQYSIIRANTAF